MFPEQILLPLRSFAPMHTISNSEVNNLFLTEKIQLSFAGMNCI